MARKRFIKNNIRPITLVVFGAMIFVVIVLRLLQLTGSNKAFIEAENIELPTVSDYTDLILPDTNPFDTLLTPSLDEQALASEDVTFLGRDGKLVEAKLSKPEGSNPFPAIVVVHDALSSSRRTAQVHSDLSDKLTNDLDVVTLTIDWRESDFGEEDLTDVLSAVNYLRNLTNVLDQPIVLFGLGHGGYLSLLASQDADVDGVISAYGYSDPNKLYIYLLDRDSELAGDFLAQTGCEFVVDSESCLLDLSLFEGQKKNINVPLLLMHSATDATVPLSESEQVLELATSPVAELYRLGEQVEEVVEEEPEEDVEGDEPALEDAPELEEALHDFFSDPESEDFESAYRKAAIWLVELFEFAAEGGVEVEDGSAVDAAGINPNLGTVDENSEIVKQPVKIEINNNKTE